jgi:PAS domain S-box-containing protein
MQKKEQKKTPLGFWEYDYDTDLLQWSDEIYSIFECDPREFTPTNQAFFDLLYPEDREKVLKAHTEQELNRQEFDVSFRIITGKGKLKYLNEQGIIKFDTSGKPVRSLGTVMDITGQRETESELEANRRLLDGIIENSNTLIYTKDLDGRYLTVNRKWEEVIGRKMEAVLGKTSLEIFGEDIHQEFSTNEAPVYREGKVITVEETVHFGGKTRYFINTAFPLRDSDGAVTGLCGTSIEITDRKEYEKALVNNDKVLRNLLNSQTNYMVRTDLEGRHTYWNRIFEENFDFLYARQGIGGGDSLLSICDYHHERTRETVAKCLASPGKIFQVELDKPTREGGICTTLWEFVCLTDEKGLPFEIQCMGIDITSQKKTTLELEKSNEKYKTLFNDSPHAFLLFSEGVYIDCNKAAEKLLRTDRSRIVGKTPLDFSPEYQPNGRRSDDYARELLSETLNKGESSFEWIHKRPEGSEFLAQIDLSVIFFEGKKVIFNSWHDITEQRKSEEQVRILSRTIEQSPVSIIITNTEGNVEYANPKALETTGYQLEELKGKNPGILKSGHTSDEEYVRMWEQIKSGKEWKGNFQNKRKNAELYWESSIITPILDKEGKITHFVAIKEDITEQKKMQEALAISEYRFNQVARESRTVIWEMDANGMYTYVSDAAEDVWGYHPSEVMGKLYFYDMHPESGKTSFKAFGHDLLTNALPLTNYYNPIQKKDGSVVWVSTSEQPVYDKEGNFAGFRGSDTDITEKKLAEDELRKFRTIADQAIYGNAIADLNGTLVYMNKAFADMHGWAIEDLLGKSIPVLHDKSQMSQVNELLGEIVTKGGIPATEVWRTRKDRSTFPSTTSAQAIFNENNEPAYIWAVAIDITSSKLAEEKIKQQNERLNAIITAIPDLVFIINADGIIEEFHISNPEKAAVPANQIPGMAISALFDETTSAKHLNHIRTCLDCNELVSYEYTLTVKGVESYFESRVVPLDEKRVLSLVRDITDRKNSEYEIFELNTRLEQKIEERTIELAKTNAALVNEIEERKKIGEALKLKTDELEKFFTVSLDLLCISNTSGYFIKLNKAWETLLGYGLSSLENSKYIDYVHPDDIESTLKAAERLINQNTVSSFTNRYRTKEGTYKYLEWFAVPVGELVFSAARDITENIRLAQSLQENIIREKELNELKSRFVSTASHEFRTPLASIQMSAETLLSYWKKMDEEKISEKLQSINSQVRHLTSIVANVMQVAKIQEGKISIKAEEVDLVAICRSIVSDFTADTSLFFEIKEEYELPSLKLFIDKRLIVQVIQNLIANAIKYSQPDPEIVIRLYLHNNQIMLTVTDNGIGIPEEDQNKIFQPFFRASNVSDIEGNGLGLNIVRDSVRLHGGDLTFESKPGKGTVFYVSLPEELLINNQ